MDNTLSTSILGLLSPWLSIILKVTFAYLIFRWSGLSSLFHGRDPREPPEVAPKIPIIGHALGLQKYGNMYMAKLLGTNHLPAFTINIVFAKYCLITSAKLLAAVQRNNKWISFEPLLVPMLERMAGVHDEKGLETLCSKLDPDGPNLMARNLHAIRPTLQGEGLNGMNMRMISYLIASLDQLSQVNEQLDIYRWIRNAITVASTDAVYGPRNPYKDPGVEQGLWDWEEGLIYLLPNILPKYTAQKAYQGRERVTTAFKKYFEIPPTLEVTSDLMMLRWTSYMVENDIGIDAMARVEAVLAFGLLVNSVPTTFWTMFEIYRRPELLQDLRQEVAQNALHIETSDSKITHVIDLDSIRKLCPHLVSTFQETLRLRMKGSLVRMIMKDTLLDPQNPDIKEQYLLKEGSLLQVTAGHFNQSAEFWGSDVLTFNSRRFMQLKNTSKARQGFLAFGTAPNTCPGRQFASGEILSLVAMLILRYDITPVGGEWIEPEINTTSLSAAVMPPKGQFMVEAKDSGQYKGCEWKFRVGEGNGRFNLIIG